MGRIRDGGLVYPEDTKIKIGEDEKKKREVMVSPKLVQFLMAHFQQEYIAGQPDDATKKVIARIMRYVIDGKWLIISLDSMDLITFSDLSRWICVVTACTLELRMIATSYGELADSVKRDEKQVDLLTRAPYVLIMFPELSARVEWLRAKLFDILANKTKSAIWRRRM